MVTNPLALADIMGGSDPAAAKAARQEIERFAHAAGAPRAGSVQRRDAQKALSEIALSKRPRLVRAHAIRLLGLIGGREEDRLLGPLERDPEIGEDARPSPTCVREFTPTRSFAVLPICRR
jgi:hypothetical protein